MLRILSFRSAVHRRVQLAFAGFIPQSLKSALRRPISPPARLTISSANTRFTQTALRNLTTSNLSSEHRASTHSSYRNVRNSAPRQVLAFGTSEMKSNFVPTCSTSSVSIDSCVRRPSCGCTRNRTLHRHTDSANSSRPCLTIHNWRP